MCNLCSAVFIFFTSTTKGKGTKKKKNGITLNFKIKCKYTRAHSRSTKQTLFYNSPECLDSSSSSNSKWFPKRIIISQHPKKKINKLRFKKCFLGVIYLFFNHKTIIYCTYVYHLKTITFVGEIKFLTIHSTLKASIGK